MKKRIIPLLLAAALLTGCWDQSVIEKTGFILLQGTELKDEDTMEVTNVIPEIGTENKNKVQIISVPAVNARDSREKSRRLAAQNLTGGKIQEMLYSEELAKRGLHDLIEVYERDPSNPILAYVVVVDGSPEKLIEKANSVEDRPMLPMYIHELLEQNMQKSQLPETRIYDYDIAYFSDGIDPVTPLIKLSGTNIDAEGSALFAGDSMVGKIDNQQTILLQALRGQLMPTDYTFYDPAFSVNDTHSSPRSGLDMLLNKAERKVTVEIRNKMPVITVNMKLKGNISEYKWDELDEKTNQSEIQSILSKEINTEYDRLIKYMQSVGSDPVGFGNIVRAKYDSYWKSIKWNQVYKKADIRVHAEVTYKRNGAIT